LEEEIDFVKNYIELERFRNSDSFSFIIDINPNVDLKFRIPRMLIHTYVENAIKYGIRRKLSGGFLKIFIQYVNRSIRIIIEDNGPGLNSTNTLTNSTGKGFVIVKQLIDLFHKLEKIRISTSMNNITGQNGEVLGARAVIELPVLKS
jgi:LytS/YehU family sensor histidine kinase